MSFPNIPNITPIIKLKRSEIINLVIASIAMEELGLSHLINAEGEKIQALLKHKPCVSEILEVNRSVERMMRNVIKQQMLLQFKLEDILLFGRVKLGEFEEMDEEEELEEEQCDE